MSSSHEIAVAVAAVAALAAEDLPAWGGVLMLLICCATIGFVAWLDYRHRGRR